jgi:hypothetical protein
MHVCFFVHVEFCQAKVDQVDFIGFGLRSHENVVRLQVAMDVEVSMKSFQGANDLFNDERTGLHAELQFLPEVMRKALPKKLHY